MTAVYSNVTKCLNGNAGKSIIDKIYEYNQFRDHKIHSDRYRMYDERETERRVRITNAIVNTTRKTEVKRVRERPGRMGFRGGRVATMSPSANTYDTIIFAASVAGPRSRRRYGPRALRYRLRTQGCARRYCRRRRVPPGGYRNVFEQFPLGPPLLAVSHVYIYIRVRHARVFLPLKLPSRTVDGGRRAHLGLLPPRLRHPYRVNLFFGGILSVPQHTRGRITYTRTIGYRHWQDGHGKNEPRLCRHDPVEEARLDSLQLVTPLYYY